MVSAADRTKRPAHSSVWLEGGGRAPRTRRADQPAGLDRERITAAAVRLLDAEGLAKFSMRRLAAELNVTAMSVYWYVDTKDDLLELAIDAVFGELTLPDPDPDPDPNPGPDPQRHQAQDQTPDPQRNQDPAPAPADWRVQLRELATGYRALLVRHPWVSPLIGRFLNIGPHSMAFALCVQRVIGTTGLPAHGQTGAMSAVFQFVYGFGTIEGHFIQRCASAGMSQDEYYREAMSAVLAQPGYERDFRRAAELMEARGGDTVQEMRERDFDFALELLIAGIEAMKRRDAAQD
ncbi:TetR/AcrR family transcriptional regulator [Streptomyces sp. NPDC093595]|uniref:TetR/AcrR family transcriptional regulator n=1 Tax=Streptomyces sp. NPDC093595 TaxID=3366045 RepID=UPI0037FBA3E8